MRQKDLKNEIIKKLESSKNHLQYSFDKVQKINVDKELDEEILETLESFASRFARYSDIVLAKYFRVLAQEKDPAWRGSMIDLINLAEKYQWIDSAETWKRIRELRNIAAHDYSIDDFRELYRELIRLCPKLLSVQHDY